jgi:L-iditol 2-dehydrogenase
MIAGIPEDDRLTLRHSLARRKGLTLVFVRRMKHTYPRAMLLARHMRIHLSALISHRFTLEQTPKAFAMNDHYQDDVVKVIIHVHVAGKDATV